MRAYREVARHGLLGWVRNRRVGSVEAVVEGDPASIERFVSWCRGGPSCSQVDSVDVEDDVSAETFSTFEIRSTA